jgi:hypothetical protein
MPGVSALRVSQSRNCPIILHPIMLLLLRKRDKSEVRHNFDCDDVRVACDPLRFYRFTDTPVIAHTQNVWKKPEFSSEPPIVR